MNSLEPPRKVALDHMLEQAKALTGVVPVYGPFAQILLNLVTTPLEKRQEEWMIRVKEVLIENSTKIEELRDNQRFISTFLTATQIALKSHQHEKLNALRHALANSVKTPSYDEALQGHFLGLVERFTEWHIRIIIFLCTKDLTMDRVNSFKHRVSVEYPSFLLNVELYDLVIADLQSSRLIRSSSSSVSLAMGADMLNPAPTEIGKSFVTFITDGN